MNKSYYFAHDYNAANDAKILFLRQQLGMEGYGIFWFILEQLAMSNGRLPLKIIPVLAMQSQTQETKVEAVIKGYELFQIAEGEFFSDRLNGHLKIRKELSEAAKEKAEKRWNAAAMLQHSYSNAAAMQRKGKEIKEIKESKEYPHLDHEFPVDHCKAVSLNDETWVMNSKATEPLLTKFNQYLLGQGIEKKHIADYKKHFYNWLKKNPTEAPKKLSFR